MKQFKLLTVLLSLTMAYGLQAQTTKGAFLLGLHNFSIVSPDATNVLAPTNAIGIGFGKYKSEFFGEKYESKYSTIGLSGNAQYFIINNLAAGVTLNVLFQNVKSDDFEDGDAKSTIVMGGPELRYFIPVSTKTKVWIGGGAAFGTAKFTYSGNEDPEEPSSLLRFGGGAGVSIFPNQHFSIDLGLQYSNFTSKYTIPDDGDFKDSFGGVAFDLGFSVFL